MFHALAETAVHSGGSDAALIGVIVTLGSALSTALTEAVKALVSRRKKENGGVQSGGKPVDSRECVTCQSETHRVLQIVSATDSRGAPLVYGAHQLAAEIREHTSEVRRLADGVERMIDRDKEDK